MTGLVLAALVVAAVVALARLTRRRESDRPTGGRAVRECTRCGGSGRARMPGAVHKTRCPMCGGRGRRPMQEGAWE
jgi:DnaJ-class molecular chaperone